MMNDKYFFQSDEAHVREGSASVRHIVGHLRVSSCNFMDRLHCQGRTTDPRNHTK